MTGDQTQQEKARSKDLRCLLAIAALLTAGCTKPMPDDQKLVLAKQCLDAGMLPNVGYDNVRCRFPEKP